MGHVMGVGQGGMDQAEVIGVVGEVRYGQMDELPQPDVYISYLQSPRRGMLLNVRAAGNATALTEAIRRQVHALNRDLPLFDVKTMEERIREATAKARFSAILLAVFAGVALVLSAGGVFGVMAYTGPQRPRGVRRPAAPVTL